MEGRGETEATGGTGGGSLEEEAQKLWTQQARGGKWQQERRGAGPPVTTKVGNQGRWMRQGGFWQRANEWGGRQAEQVRSPFPTSLAGPCRRGAGRSHEALLVNVYLSRMKKTLIAPTGHI
ncbi:UNVERIFIED_CONTAM: hypothetical protein K2H54_028498 [Gekko kuhli]